MFEFDSFYWLTNLELVHKLLNYYYFFHYVIKPLQIYKFLL